MSHQQTGEREREAPRPTGQQRGVWMKREEEEKTRGREGERRGGMERHVLKTNKNNTSSSSSIRQF